MLYYLFLKHIFPIKLISKTLIFTEYPLTLLTKFTIKVQIHNTLGMIKYNHKIHLLCTIRFV